MTLSSLWNIPAFPEAKKDTTSHVRTVYSAAIVLLLFGCATPANMRLESPALELSSFKPAKSVSVCIAERWENLGVLGTTVPVNVRPSESGYVLSWQNDVTKHTALLVDVNETETGSVTRYYKNLVLGEGQFDQAVKDCQN